MSRIKTPNRRNSQIREACSPGKRGEREKRKDHWYSLRRKKKEEKKPILDKASILMKRRKYRNKKKRPANQGEMGEITFPPLLNVRSADPVVIKAYIPGRQVNRVYLDGGSSCEVIYEHCFLKLKPSIKSIRVDSNTPLVGFSGEQSRTLGEIPLEITIGEGPIMVTKTLTFVIVKADSPHNLLLGRTAMQQMGIVVSTIYGAIKFHTPRGIGTIFSEYNSQKPKEEEGGLTNKYQGNEEIILSFIDTEERVVINDKYPEQKITIGRQLPKSIKIRLRDLLKRYIDVFAWTSAHITGTWVSNPMVVKKDNEKWKLRVDFTNINKACIREPHLLPAAEQKVEGLRKYCLKCFLDAYKGYHQIPIAEEDEEKIAFFTKDGVFCYKRLPFGLKNAGATYQRLIDKVFVHQMGRNMEVNADDMVIMSDSEEEMMADITETLEKLREINLKLNLKKCSFGV
ncbi:reverse transcriptase domain-containing protein [Tanacetum coccineum]